MGEKNARVRGQELTPPSIDKTKIRDAATVIVMRDADHAPKVLMGQRGAKAAFMPNMFVFPGGAVDAGDAQVPLHPSLPDACMRRLQQQSDPDLTHRLISAAIRELWEETGLTLGAPGQWHGPVPEGWEGFAQSGHLPSAQDMHFIFRAITPPGRPRRFDARFFLVDAARIAGDLDDFSGAEDELSHLQWIPIHEARQFNLPFITEVVLAEVMGMLKTGLPPKSVPFFRNTDTRSEFLRIS